MQSAPGLRYRKLAAPREDGQALIEPGVSRLAQTWEGNRRRLGQLFTGEHAAWRAWSTAARRDLLRLAEAYVAAYRGEAGSPLDPAAPLVLTGHQPVLFHPGVWFKNFAAASFAQQLGGHAVNVIVDNDLAGSPAIKVPVSGELPGRARVETVPFDRPHGPRPFEEQTLVDSELFNSFDSRVAAEIAPCVAAPLVRPLWKFARRAARRTDRVGSILAEARHQLEHSLGLTSWEVPLSQLSDSRSFRQFAFLWIVQADRLGETYNAVVEDYRHLHRVRSRAHPVPNLAAIGEWIEVPFWLWSVTQPLRQRLLVRFRPGAVELQGHLDQFAGGNRVTLPVDQPGVWGAAEQLAAAWEQWAAQGWKLRPRALMTTAFARLGCGDLFLHGIGGAKYDQLTDEIIRRWLGAEPPQYHVLTATFTLAARPEQMRPEQMRPEQMRPEQVQPEQMRAVDRTLRDLKFNPQRHLPDEGEWARRLAAEKQRWIEADAPGQRRTRHAELARITQALQPLVEAERQRLLELRRRMELQWRDQRKWSSREYAFCLFGEDLPGRLRELLEPGVS